MHGRSFLGEHVFRVIFIRAKKQMLWIHARRVIAFVTNQHSFRYRTFKKNPCGSMCLFNLPKPPAGHRKNSTVPSSVLTTQPQPTTSCSIFLIKSIKAHKRWLSWRPSFFTHVLCTPDASRPTRLRPREIIYKRLRGFAFIKRSHQHRKRLGPCPHSLVRLCLVRCVMGELLPGRLRLVRDGQ